jgi:hypothetical protein
VSDTRQPLGARRNRRRPRLQQRVLAFSEAAAAGPEVRVADFVEDVVPVRDCGAGDRLAGVGVGAVDRHAAAVPRPVRVIRLVMGSMAPSILPGRKKLSAGLLPVATLATARWIRVPNWSTITSARTDQSVAEMCREHGIGCEQVLDQKADRDQPGGETVDVPWLAVVHDDFPVS